MPASICDTVSSALRLSLAEDSQSSSLLDSRLYSSAKSVLLSKIEFVESGDYQSNVLDGLKSKYVVIRSKKPVLENKLLKKDVSSDNQSAGNGKICYIIACDVISLHVWQCWQRLYFLNHVNIYNTINNDLRL